VQESTGLYSEEVAAQILEHIEDGGTIASACKLDGMPCPSTLRRWRKGDGQGVSEDFGERFEKALTIRLEGFVDDLLQLPRDIDPDHPGELQRARLECENRRWLLSKMLREKFGERTAVDMGGQRENPFNPSSDGEKAVHSMHPETLAAIRKALRNELQMGGGTPESRSLAKRIVDRTDAIQSESTPE
jgi:transposase-like protein